MQEIGIEELKSIELNMLIFIDKTCKESNLRYFLCGGTLLGAVRHHGFIPWDDDIDIFMPRPDYERLIELIKDSERYKLLENTDKDYYYNFGKLVDKHTAMIERGNESINGMGVYIDIFPLDGMPNNEGERAKHFEKLDKIRRRITSFSVGKPHFRKNLGILLVNWFYYITNKTTSIQVEQKKYIELAKQYSYDSSEFVYATGGAYKKKDIFPRAWLSAGTELTFESVKFQVPTEYDKYLKQLYGNYMELPPVEKRVSHHHFVAHYIDKK